MRLSADAVERVAEVFEGLDLGDPRRSERLRMTMELLAAAPEETLPTAMRTDANLKGAYRLLSNDAIESEALNEQHARSTAERARAAARVFAIHDTTEFEFPRATAEEIGYLRTGHAGFEFHYALIVDGSGEQRRPLGVANAEAMFRERPPQKRARRGSKRSKASGQETVRDPERRSLRWSRGFAKVATALEGAQVIHLADREGDNYELFGRAMEAGQRFVIRVRVHDRVVENEDGEEGSIKTVLEKCAGMMTREVSLSTRRKRTEPHSNQTHPPRAARMASLSFSATSVRLSRPRYQARDLPEQLHLNAVRVNEPKPPAGEKPVEWMLLTTEPITTAQEVAEVVDAYRARWLIEECNKVIKTGCKYEARHVESRQALLTLLAMTLPIACEVLWLRSRAREQPGQPAHEVLTHTQLDVLRALGPRKLSAAPTIHEALWAVAKLGGHLANNGEPGWQVLHRGMSELLAYERGWIAAQHAHRRRPRL
jgi:Transposase DNA-binding/Transposase DDE domain